MVALPSCTAWCLRPALWAVVLLLPVGCQLPPAELAGVGPDGDRSIGGTIAQQQLVDLAVAARTQPARTTALLTSDVTLGLEHAGRVILQRRLVFPFLKSAGPLTRNDEPGSSWVDETTLQPSRIDLDLDGREALRKLECLLERACVRIDVLMYEWNNDDLGWALARLLAARAASLGPGPEGGPSVRIRVDAGTLLHASPGIRTAREANAPVIWLASQPHVRVLRGRDPLGHFDHRKLILIDGWIAWSGGRNFTEGAFFYNRDLSYTLCGPLVLEMAALFEQAWKESGGEPGLPLHAPLLAPEIENARACIVTTGQARRDFAHAIYAAVDNGCHHVYIENPYFTDAKLMGKLVRARQRGVDVRLVFASESQSDLIDHALRPITNRLLRLGIRVYFQPGITHVKAAAIDGCWAYIGTGNFDSLSFRRNSEVGLVVGSGPIIQEVEKGILQGSFQDEWEVTSPLPVSLKDRLAEWLAMWVL
jgi:cardiolipin synthase A/B